MSKKIQLPIIIAIAVGSGMISGAFFGVHADVFQSTYAKKSAQDQLAPQTYEVLQEESATVSVVDAVSPAVVSIAVYQEVENLYSSTGPFLFDFFGHRRIPDSSGELRLTGGGSGFIISSDGLIATNRHVVDDDNASYKVVMSDGSEHDAQVLAADQILDFALLEIEGSDFPTAALGDSDAIVRGQTVIAIGNALTEFSNTVTRGIVSGVNRRVVAGDGHKSELIEEAIQTDAAINPGNSGGPLVNLKGEVLGINTAVSSRGQLIGFATPINPIKNLINSFEKHGKIVRPLLGVRYVMITPALAQERELPTQQGAYIMPARAGEQPSVVLDGPASKAGIQEGDIVISINNIAVTNEKTLARVISEFSPDDTVELQVKRGGEDLRVSVRLGTLE